MACPTAEDLAICLDDFFLPHGAPDVDNPAVDDVVKCDVPTEPEGQDGAWPNPTRPAVKRRNGGDAEEVVAGPLNRPAHRDATKIKARVKLPRWTPLPSRSFTDLVQPTVMFGHILTSAFRSSS